MVKYSLNLNIKNNSIDETYQYILDLTLNQENNPQSIFNQEIKESMTKTLQSKSGCRINNRNLDRLINNWIQDIRQGYRETYLTLDLPLLIEADLAQVKETGNQQLPELLEPDISEIIPQGGAFPPLIFR